MGSSKDKPATDGDGGGYTSEEDKATSARFAVANSRPRDAEARIFFPSGCCANSERPKIYGFSVVEAHGKGVLSFKH
jgi:hypothetical protein